MKRIAILFLATLLTCSCGSSSKNSSDPTNPATPAVSLAGLWTVQFTDPKMPAGYQQIMTATATLVPGPCSFDVPAGFGASGTHAVAGPVCYIANLNTGQGVSEITAGVLRGMNSAMVVGVPKQAQRGSPVEFQLGLWNTPDEGESIVYVGTGVVSGTAQAPTFSGSFSTPGQAGAGNADPWGTFTAEVK